MLETKYILTAAMVCFILFSIHLLAAVLLEERRFSKRKTAFLWLVAGVILFLSVLVFYSFLPRRLRLAVSLLVSFFYFWGTFIYLSADGLWKKCYLWVTYGTVFCILWPFSVTLSKLILSPAHNVLSYLLRAFLQFIFCLPILLLYRKYIRELIRNVSGFHTRTWLNLFVFSIIYFVLFLVFMIFIVSLEEVSGRFVILYLLSVSGYVVATTICIGTIYSMKKEERDDLMKENMEYMLSYVENVRVMEAETRRIRHDVRHHNERIAFLARENDTKGILEYLGESGEERERQAFCPNIVVSGILSSYAGKAEEKGISFTASADTPVTTTINDVDFVSILSNLLENALNATLNLKSDGPIRADIKRVGDKTVIVVSNPSPPLKIEGGLPFKRSTGIDSIIISARKYNGDVNYSLSGGVLTAMVVLTP